MVGALAPVLVLMAAPELFNNWISTFELLVVSEFLRLPVVVSMLVPLKAIAALTRLLSHELSAMVNGVALEVSAVPEVLANADVATVGRVTVLPPLTVMTQVSL